MGQGHTRNFIPKRLLSWEPATSVGKKVRKHLHIAKCAGSTGGACVCVRGCGCVCVHIISICAPVFVCQRVPVWGHLQNDSAYERRGRCLCTCL